MFLIPILSIDIVCWIQQILFVTHDMLFLISDIFDKLLIFIIMGACFSWVILYGYSQGKINLLQIQIIIVAYIGVIIYFTFSCTVFEEQRILKRNLFNYSGIVYKLN
jgi:hypothetical protein